MAKKIPPEIDIQIIRDLGLGIPNVTIAHTYNVSTAYVSKVRNGKKHPYIHVVRPSTSEYKEFEINNNEINELLAFLDTKDILVNKEIIVNHIEKCLNECLIKAKIYQELLKKINFKQDINN